MYNKHKKSVKTIFVLINRSFITRNILRSGTLELLKKAGHKIVVYFPAHTIPEYLRDEFEDNQVTLCALEIKKRSRLHRYFNRLKRYLVITNNTKLRIRYRGPRNTYRLKDGIVSKVGKPGWRIWIELAALYSLSRIPFFKSLFRFIERAGFPEHDEKIKEALSTFKPNLIFSTALGGTFEYPFFKEAHRRGITTMGMIKSWDNISNEYFPVIPDYFIAQNKTIQKKAHDIQKIKKENIFIIGMPQFDWYKRKDVLFPKEEYLRSKGLDPKRSLIFFGLEGVWAPNDHKIAEKIYTWIINNELAKPCQLLVRTHFSNVGKNVLEKFRNKPHVVVDDYKIVDFLTDKWDPSIEEIINFTNGITHSSVVISVASSLSLDAACADTPALTLGFGSEYIDGEDVTTKKLYSTDHVGMLMKPGGTTKVDSYDELKETINAYLLNPKLNTEGRENTREMLCYKVDGKASLRLVAAIEEVLNK